MDVSTALDRLDLDGARCFVVIRREGLAARVGHDLRLAVEGLTVRRVGEYGVEADIAADSLRVLGALKADGSLDTSALSAKDRGDVESRVRREILQAPRFPTVSFRCGAIAGRGDVATVDGQLTLRAATRPLRLEVRLGEDEALATGRLNQPEFGIKPYKAMLGALRVAADVELEVRVPLREA